MSRLLFLFWEYARYFPCALSQFSNKKETGGMLRAGWTHFLFGVLRWFNGGRNIGDTVSLWKTKTFRRRAAQVPTQQ